MGEVSEHGSCWGCMQFQAELKKNHALCDACVCMGHHPKKVSV